MTQIRLTGLLSDIKGKLGGSSFQDNADGLYFKNWQKPKNTISQQSSRTHQNFRYLQQAWKTLTPGEREQWNYAASQQFFKNKLGENFHPSGINLFCSLNKNLLLLGKLMLTAPVAPAYYLLADGAQLQYMSMFNQFQINIINYTGYLDLYYVGFISRPLSPGVSAIPQNMVFCDFVVSGTPSIIISDALYFSLFKCHIQPNKKYFCKLFSIDGTSGKSSIPLYSSLVL